MLYGFTYDGRHSSEFNLTVTSVKRKLHAPVKPRLVSVPQKPGAYNYGKPEIGHLVIEVSVIFTAQDNRSFHDLRRDIIAWLYRDKEVELVFDEEPDKYYMAQYSEESDIDRLGTAGSTTLYFISSDPYAFGETKTQRIANPYAVFKREGIRYRDDGTEVTENYPVYKPGKFDQAILVEEGTENLLPSASSPTQEELSLTVGDDYYLSIYGGSATIEHKKTETINRTLDKEGADYSSVIDTEWESGTHFGTLEVSNNYLRLAKSGADYDKTWDTREEWEDPANTRVNTGSDDINDNLDLINLPQWNFVDHFDDYTLVWRVVGSDGEVIQNEEEHFVTIRGTNVSSNYGIDIQNDPNIVVRFPATVILKYRNQGPDAGRLVIGDGESAYYLIELDDLTGDWVYLWLAISNNTCTVYKNGQLVGEIASGGESTINQIQIYIPTGRTATLDVDFIYIDWDYNKGAPPADGWWMGTWETPYIDLSSVGFVKDATIGWHYEHTHPDQEAANLEDSGISIEYQLRQNGVEQGWVTLFNDATQEGASVLPIGGLPRGTDVSGTEIKIRVTLQTKDPANWPYLEYLRLSVASGHYPSGHYESPVVAGLRQVGKAAETSISWVADSVPSGTSVKVYTRLSLDGGNMWSDWTEVANSGDPIPEISQSTDLSNAIFQYRIELSTTDIAVTPSVDSISLSFTSGYKPSQTFTLKPIDVSDIGTAISSVIDWTATTPSGTSVTVETSLDGTTWTPVTDGGTLIPDGTDLTGKSLHIRYTLSTSDTNFTPTMESLEWRIAQAEPNRIKPATGTLVLTPDGVDRWQLENKPYSTGWHAYGSPRNDESLQVPVEIDGEGTIELWAHDDGRSLQRDRFIFDAEGVLSLRKAADENYVVAVNGSDVLTIAPPPSGWHYWAVRWNETTVDVFLDGESVATFPLGNPLNFEAVDRLFIGCSEAGEQWNGLLDDLRVSFAARSDEEIAAAFASGKPAEADDRTDYKFAFDGSLAPTVSKTFEIGGTAPTQGIFTATFINKAPYFKISNEIEYVQVDVEFEPGDILEIDCVREVVRKNGSREDAMPFVYIESDFFDLIPGGTIFVEPEGVAKVDATFTERWR